MNSKKLGLKIKECRRRKGLTQEALAKLTALSRSYIAGIERNVYNPSLATLSAIASNLEISVDFLLGNVAHPDNPALYPYINSSSLEPLPSTEVVLEASASYAASSLAHHEPAIFIFECVDDSLQYLGITAGDQAIIHQQDTVKDGDLALVQLPDGSKQLKRLRMLDDLFVLETANPAYPTLVLKKAASPGLKILGKVIQIRKNF
ncbi:MAG TPA: helix-turn-helix domain-containing protein [Candidatus Avacidaminococcus intestinavium]|uniref:Helix-turn-helix domain-containing protein n=1 Tax=Candidatus Avacidaminococcus intestinavium TaxID=2840684 RepID=A0A9D1SLA9_9FIRM|nr:helix-turn-helix domain-containing protein [Candidatus Avacidaminococcus intestinavium]